MDYAQQAKEFEEYHGFPAPPEEVMAELPEWPISFCSECKDWHEPDEQCSAQ